MASHVSFAPIIKGQASWTAWPDRFFPKPRCVTSQKNADPIYTSTEALNRASVIILCITNYYQQFCYCLAHENNLFIHIFHYIYNNTCSFVTNLSLYMAVMGRNMWEKYNEIKKKFINICAISWYFILIVQLVCRPPLWSSGQSFWLQIQRSWVRFSALPDFLSSSRSGTGSTQPREVN